MTTPETQPAEPNPQRAFQFSLRTLLLLFVVLGSSLAVFGAWGIVVFGLVVMLAIYIHRVKSLLSLAHLALAVLCLMCLIGMLMPAIAGGGASPRQQCAMHLDPIAGALQKYHATNGCFPPAYVADKNGKPMHSWRTLLLPYLDHNDLYKAYDFTEPWDGPKNKRLSAIHVSEFACPSDPGAKGPNANETSYVAVVGPNGAWTGEKPRKMGDFPAPSHTIILVEVANSGISWAEPTDLSLDESGAADGKFTLDVSSRHSNHSNFFFTYDRRAGINVVMGDGSVCYVPSGGLSAANLRKILAIGGCDRWDIDRYEEDYDLTRRPNWPNIAALAAWLLSAGMLLTKAVRSRKVLSIPPTPS